MKQGLLFFVSIYFLQGAILAMFKIFLKPMLLEDGMSPERLAKLFALITLPFTLKIVIGLGQDFLLKNLHITRKAMIRVSLALNCLAFFACYFLSSNSGDQLFASSLFLLFFCMAFYDVATDAVAVELSHSHEQAQIQAAMLSGRALGFIVFSLLIGFVTQAFGSESQFLLLAVLPLVILFTLTQVKEGKKEKHDSTWSFEDLALLREPRFWVFALYLFSAPLLTWGADGLLSLFLKEKQSLNQQGLGYYGSLRGVGVVCGAFLCAFLQTRCSLKKLGITALIALSTLLVFMGLLSEHLSYLFIALFWGLAWSFHETIILRLAMIHTPKNLAASAFSFYMMLMTIGIAGFERYGTPLALEHGFEWIFTRLPILLVILLPSFVFVTRRALRGS